MVYIEFILLIFNGVLFEQSNKIIFIIPVKILGVFECNIIQENID